MSALKEMFAEESEKSVILNVDAAGLLIFSKVNSPTVAQVLMTFSVNMNMVY